MGCQPCSSKRRQLKLCHPVLDQHAWQQQHAPGHLPQQRQWRDICGAAGAAGQATGVNRQAPEVGSLTCLAHQWATQPCWIRQRPGKAAAAAASVQQVVWRVKQDQVAGDTSGEGRGLLRLAGSWRSVCGMNAGAAIFAIVTHLMCCVAQVQLPSAESIIC
jgi:hypothetical protein